jgi:hypothetical protein
VAHCLDDVARSGLALGADHRRALRDAPERFPEVRGPADERNLEGLLFDVVRLVRRRENLGLVDVVDLESFEDLSLGEVADPGFGHDRDGHGSLDALDHRRIGHAGNAPVAADVRRHPLECHDGDGPGVLGDARLLRRDDVHDDAALEHLGEAAFHAECGAFCHPPSGYVSVPALPVRQA